MKSLKTSDDLLNYFHQQALLQCEKMGINPDKIIESLAIIKNSFSSMWLEKALLEQQKNNPIKPRSVCLIDLLLVPMSKNIHLVIDLSLYIKKLNHIKNFDKLLEMLKTDTQFENTFLQMVFGYKFLKVSDNNSIIFEPDADDNKKADIQFLYKGQIYIVECFKPSRKAEQHVYSFINDVSNALLEYAQDVDKKVIVFIEFKNLPNNMPDFKKEIVVMGKQMIKESDGVILSKKTDAFLIQVQKFNEDERSFLFDAYYDRSFVSIKSSKCNKNDLNKVTRNEAIYKEDHSMQLRATALVRPG